MAVYGFKGVGWFLCGVIVAPGCYLVTSQVAAERAELARVERAIVAAHQDIRNLETEFSTRANLAQLEQWNGDALKLAAPSPDQFLADPMALASYDPMTGNSGLQQASLVVPTGVERPAPVAMAAAALSPSPRATPEAAPRGGSEPQAPRSRPVRAEGPVRLASADTRTVGNGAATRAMAMLDDGLLSPETMATLRDRAQTERLALR